MSRTAVITGYTGLVGRLLLDRLLASDDYAQVLAVGRREPQATSEKLRWLRSELDDLGDRSAELTADDAFCCLGTTRKAAGSKAAFERVDFHMVVDFARAAHQAGSRRFFLVSALSANARSPIYYNRIKGRAEEAVTEIGFDTLHILRPSLLLGQREQKRPGERVAQKIFPILNPVLLGPFRAMRAVAGSEVADALIQLASGTGEGTQVHSLPLE